MTDPQHILRLSEQELEKSDRALRVAREWLSRAAYAEKYGVSLRTVWKWLDVGALETYRVGKILRIRDLPPDQHHVNP